MSDRVGMAQPTGTARGGATRDRRHPVSRRRMFRAMPALAAVLASACSAGGAPPPPAELRGRVEIWFSAFRFDQGVGGEVVQEVRRQYPNLDVVASAVTGDRVQKLQVAAAANSAPDIGEAGAWQMQEFGAAGIAAPVDPYLRSSKVVKQ